MPLLIKGGVKIRGRELVAQFIVLYSERGDKYVKLGGARGKSHQKYKKSGFAIH